MSKVTVKDLDVKGKHVIVRVDFNVPHKGSVITDDNRVRAALPTINYLTENGAKVLLLSHLGKVKTEEDKAKNDMSIVADCLAKLQSAPVKFVNATRGAELEEAVKNQEEGSIVLMQNTRYEKGESKNDPELGMFTELMLLQLVFQATCQKAAQLLVSLLKRNSMFLARL